MARRKRIPWIPIAVAAIILAALLAIPLSCEPEALNTDQILAKEEWEREELVDTLTHIQVQRKGSGIQREVYQHLRKQMERYSEKERRAIMEESLSAAMNESLRQWRAMEPKMREKLVDSLLAQARKNRKNLEEMSPAQKEKMSQRLQSPETQEALKKMRQRMLSKLTTSERQMLSPLVREWVDTLESL